MQFEGPEKKFELIQNSSARDLRSFGAQFWSDLVALADASILSSISNAHCDAYLLSESSLFVYSDRVIMITCGRTNLVPAIKLLFSKIDKSSIAAFIYERKNENFPELQPQSFEQDVEQLSQYVQGSSHLFGKKDQHFVSLFHINQKYKPAKFDSTLEILMHDIHPDILGAFRSSSKMTLKAETIRKRAKTLLPDFLIDEHLFTPRGYSLNAIRDENYYTFHITPEQGGSYVSFETNCFLDAEQFKTISLRVLNLFKPDRFDLVAFEPPSNFEFLNTSYTEQSPLCKELECGYKLSYGHYRLRSDMHTSQSEHQREATHLSANQVASHGR